MNEHLQRARVLLQTGRAAMAEAELRLAIASDPGDADAHALLAWALVRQDKPEPALAAAREAVALAPDASPIHLAHAAVLDQLDRLGEAEFAVGEAIRLDPEDPDARALLASLHLQRRRWDEGLAAAEAGLALDPAHADCANLKGMALVQLGRREEAAATVEGALGRNPESATTHANLGWAHLHAGAYDAARTHFREALRLEPDHEWARQGILESIKAKNPLYRLLLRWLLWLGRLGARAQVAILLGLWLGNRVVRDLANDHPTWAPYLRPLLWAYGLFVLLTWLGDPLANLALRLHPVGKHALSRAERRASSVVGLLLLGALVALASYLVQRHPFPLVAALVLGTLTLPASAVLGDGRGAKSPITRGLAALLAAIGGLTLASFFVPGLAFALLLEIYVWGLVAFSWVSVAVAVRTPR